MSDIICNYCIDCNILEHAVNVDKYNYVLEECA